MKKIITLLLIIIILSTSTVIANADSGGTVKIISNGNTTFLIQPDGNVKGWGRNTKGELGIGTIIDEYLPINIDGLSNIIEIIPASNICRYFLAIDKEGYVYSWGYNSYGQLGIGTTLDQLTPKKVMNLPRTKEIIINDYSVYALTYDGDVYAWGKNAYGQLGNGTTTNKSTPNKVGTVSDVNEIICGRDTVFALTEDKQVYVWGKANDFQLGNGNTVLRQMSPVLISSLSNVDEVITNGVTSFAICNNRQDVYSWGEGWSGELGTYSERNRTPKRLWELSDLDTTIDDLITYQSTCYAIMSDNTLYGWGENGNYQLGVGGCFDKGKPTIIPNLPEIKEVTFNGITTVALGVDGNVYAWGQNTYGTKGIDSSTINATAQKVSGVSNIKKLINGYNAIYVLNSNGLLYSWGSNLKGQLGIGTFTKTSLATVVSGIENVKEVVKADDSVYAISSDGKVYSWGENDYGQVGDGTLSKMAIPYLLYEHDMKTVNGTGDVQSTIPVVGNIQALKVSITHPINVSYSIDPNSDDSFVCPDIHIVNNSKVLVKVNIKSFRSSDIEIEDVMPDSYDWDTLNSQDTKRYLALGIEYVDESELRGSHQVLPLYAAQIDNDYIGVLSSGDEGILRLNCFHGLAFEGSFTAQHELIFVISLY